MTAKVCVLAISRTGWELEAATSFSEEVGYSANRAVPVPVGEDRGSVDGLEFEPSDDRRFVSEDESLRGRSPWPSRLWLICMFVPGPGWYLGPA